MDLGLSAEQLTLQARARAFANEIVRPRAAEIDASEEYPWDIVKALTEAKAIKLMLAQPSVIKRPVLELPGGKLLVGFRPETYAAAVAK